MPKPVEAGRSYIPGLDGLRAVAVLMVIAYHLNVPGASGGNLGVGVFFTLSGYLITDLLLAHWRRHGNLGLGTFWLRRARRLLPALFLMLVLVSIWVAVFDAGQLASVRRQVVSAALYVANWSTIAQHGSYFARFATPLPLDHLWSLAIEEQFYLLWPWLIWLGIRAVRSPKRLALLTLVGAVASAVVMGQLYHRGYDPTRVYEGTDTRAFGLLIGAALAIVLPTKKAQRGAPADVQILLDRTGIAALVLMLLLVWRTNAFSSFLYPGGFLVLSVATALVIAAVVNPASRLGTALGSRPLRWIGVRSYGIYLWQSPIIVLANPNQTTFNLPRAVLEVGATLIIASLSWRYVEEPIRHGALGRVWRQMRAGAQRLGVRRRAQALSGAAAAALLLAVVGLAGALPVASSGAAGPHKIKLRPGRLPVLASGSYKVAAKRGGGAASTSASASTTPARRTSCRSVVYIGDSTSEGEISTDYIPDPRLRLEAQLADFGVTTTYPEISGARSIYETFEGQPNAETVAQDHISSGFNGCWIIAMGTNDVDNVNTGSTVGYAERINRMMSIIGRRPALWVDAITLLSDGAYRERDMQKWNATLLTACQRYPNMRVFDWAADAKPRWFIPDGIHYYSPGYVARTHLIAQALANAFPEGAPPASSCVVR
jgi:peptidoglycan/LPS O-acetylase OafA/YrhL